MTDSAQSMIDWIRGAPPADLAAELLPAFAAAFGAADAQGARGLAQWMLRGYPHSTNPFDTSGSLAPILEAAALLQNSDLIYLRGGNDPIWSITRLGNATLASGKDAVRQRIKDRTGL